jgi:lipopolysaccharide export system protein LptA
VNGADRLVPENLPWMIVALVLVAGMPGGGWAQSLNIGGANSNSPMEVFADEGIEWEQDRKVFTARGNARAVRGEVEVTADLLRAYYREKPGGGSDIWRLDAEGNVKVSSPGETAFGDSAIYDLDNAILVLTGRKVRFVTAEDEITADRQLEYWEAKQMAVARGNAYAVRGNKKLRADVLSAHFRKDKSGKTKIYRVDAFDNVYIVAEQDTITADRGVYNVESGIATLTGSVKLSRDGNQLNGCSAVVNLNTGISKLKSCANAGTGTSRVQGLFRPGNVKKK